LLLYTKDRKGSQEWASLRSLLSPSFNSPDSLGTLRAGWLQSSKLERLAAAGSLGRVRNFLLGKTVDFVV
jgi:hypothetical protein